MFLNKIKKISFNRSDLIIGIVAACLCVFFSFMNFSVFESLERVIYGIEMRLALPQSTGASKIAIVNIDEKSLKQVGPWPWPRHIIAEMITILRNNGAKLIGLDLLFSEKENNQGLHEVRELYKAILEKEDPESGKEKWLLNTLKEIEKRLDNDKILAQSVKETDNIILPVIGSFGKFDTSLILSPYSSLTKSAIAVTSITQNIEDIVSVNQLIASFDELSQNSRGFGHVNLSPNRYMAGRAHLLFFNYRGYLIPSMPLSLAFEYSNKRLDNTTIRRNGIQLIKTVIPATKGEILIKYKGGRRSFPYYSFVDILKVKNVPAVFKDKIVLIGYTAEGGDTVNTPVDLAMPRVELTANIIEDLMESRYLKRPGAMVFVEAFLIILLGLSFSAFSRHLTFTNRTSVTIGLVFIFILVGVLSFVVLDTWFKIVYICLYLIMVYVIIFARDIIVSQRTLGLASKESIETNRMLGLSFQSQGLLDLAFEKFRKCPLDDSMKDVIYNLGLDYERKRMINKAVAIYEYISQHDNKFRDLNGRIPKLKNVLGSLSLITSTKGRKEERILMTDDLEIKPTVGRYEVVKELGQGAMGIVYQAKDPKINRLLAIKTIRFSDEFEEDKIKEVKNRFFKEAEIAGKLSHPSIVAIYDVGEDYDLTYLAMEFLEGGDLRNYCQKESLLPLRTVLYIIKEAALALDYAHKKEVIHRDIKPANIMLLKDGKIKVTDFGIAKAVSSSQTKSGVILGTPNYMSPEQINGDPIDGRSDLFSLGVVFFELLCGQLPFQGKNLTSLLYNVTQARHPSLRSINPKIPKACEQIIDRILAKDPEKRFQNGEELAKYLNALIKKMDQVPTKTT